MHGLHAVAPVPALWVPGGHRVHSGGDVAEASTANDPAGQGDPAGSTAPSTQACPGRVVLLHGRQEVAPRAGV